jgi:hypothetical protein
LGALAVGMNVGECARFAFHLSRCSGTLSLAAPPDDDPFPHLVRFEILGDIEDVHRIAAGPNVRVRALLRKAYGAGRWRKMKGIAMVRPANGQVRRVELIGSMKRTGLADVTSRSSAT